MSVIRRPDVLGRQGRRRIVGISGAAWAATVESLSVGTWYALLVVEPRTAFTALGGLSVLAFGALLRTGIVGSVLGGLGRYTLPRRALSAVALSACWLCWLLVAERIDGRFALPIAGAVLVVLLSLQFALERRAVSLHAVPRASKLLTVPGVRTALLPAVVLAVGSTILLATSWYAESSLLAVVVPLGEESATVDVPTALVGLVGFACCSFLAQERRLRRLLDA
ncbi:MAG: hypothetical protein ACOCPZ_03480 [Natrialbaceae archaeon]